MHDNKIKHHYAVYVYNDNLMSPHGSASTYYLTEREMSIEIARIVRNLNKSRALMASTRLNEVHLLDDGTLQGYCKSKDWTSLNFTVLAIPYQKHLSQTTEVCTDGR